MAIFCFSTLLETLVRIIYKYTCSSILCRVLFARMQVSDTHSHCCHCCLKESSLILTDSYLTYQRNISPYKSYMV